MFPERKENEQNFTITKDGVEYKLPVHWSLTDSGSYTFGASSSPGPLPMEVMQWGMERLTDGLSRWSFPWKVLRKKTMTKC